MSDNFWATIDYKEARGLYDQRHSTHLQLLDLYERRDIPAYLDLALDIDQPGANYSASDHPTKLGPLILRSSQPARVFDLAVQFMRCDDPLKIPSIIYGAKMRYLKIAVGSEMAAMLRPDVFWVTNTRTIWAHLVVKHRGDTEVANEELRLYREQDSDSEMDYRIWRAMHELLQDSLSNLADLANVEAPKQGVQPGELTFLWADAVANTMYIDFGWSGKPRR